MIRGTTPTITFDLGIDPRAFTACYITFMQDRQVILEKSLQDLTIGETSVSFTMTQDETLCFTFGKTCIAQVRAKDAEGNALASGIMRMDVENILKDGVI